MKQWNCRALEEEEKDDLLAKAELCRLAMAAEGQPYLLPVAVQTQKDETGEWTFRIQSPVYGMKMEYLKANRRVALEFEGSSAEGTDSVVAFGIARFRLRGGGKAEIKITPYQISGRRYYAEQKHPEE